MQVGCLGRMIRHWAENVRALASEQTHARWSADERLGHRAHQGAIKEWLCGLVESLVIRHEYEQVAHGVRRARADMRQARRSRGEGDYSYETRRMGTDAALPMVGSDEAEAAMHVWDKAVS